MDYSLNRIVAIPNWSFYDPDLCEEARSLVAERGLTVHYAKGDIDHQRTVTAFSGTQSDVFDALDALADFLLPYIDLQVQKGVHPRVGGLDVAPFVLLEGYEPELIEGVTIWALKFSNRFDVPVHLYEKAAKPGREHRLPYLRGQVGNLDLAPDFGHYLHPKWGKTIVGVRDFLLAANLNLLISDIATIKSVAQEIRFQRDHGHLALQGVRALAFELKSQGMTQLSLNLTDPNATTFDGVFAIAEDLLDGLEIFIETELIGVIRERDVAGAQHLTFDPSQVVY